METHQPAISFEVVQWSEQSRSVTSAWLGTVRHSVQIRLCTRGFKSEKMFGIIIIVLVIVMIIITPNIFSLLHPLVQSRT